MTERSACGLRLELPDGIIMSLLTTEVNCFRSSQIDAAHCFLCYIFCEQEPGMTEHVYVEICAAVDSSEAAAIARLEFVKAAFNEIDFL